MVLGQVFERFIEESPVSVMVRGLMEKFLSPQKLDQLFERNSEIQYTKELLFSTGVEMMSAVTCGIRPSIPAADQARAHEVGVSVTSVYNKLNFDTMTLIELTKILLNLAAQVNLAAFSRHPRSPKKTRRRRKRTRRANRPHVSTAKILSQN
jgi:hypothetical protein